MSDVTSTGYQPDFDIDNRRGAIGEQVVGTFLEQLGHATFEVKTEYQGWSTGNHYVETHQQRSSGEWVPSGINTTKADWWCIAGPDERGFIAIRVDDLKRLALKSPKSSQPVRGRRSNPTKGRLVTLADIVKVVIANGGERPAPKSEDPS